MSSPSGASFSLRCLIYKVHAVPGGTLLLYLISFRLSRTFFRSFLTSDPSRISSNLFRLPHLSLAVKNFFHFFPARLITAPTALLEYQILPLLSTPFFAFSRFFPTAFPPTVLRPKQCHGFRRFCKVFRTFSAFHSQSLLL